MTQALRNLVDNLTTRAERAQNHEVLELLASVSETIDNLSDPQSKNARILRDLEAWLRAIESKLAA